jgi:LysR family nod box-dependent transcriptional activator
MRLNRFDLNLLLALDALLSEKNVTRAAARIGLTQPAMSAALHRLRDYFGDPLLQPTGRTLTLSPRGLALVEPVREAVLHIETALDAQPRFDPAKLRGAFRVVVADFLTPLVIPEILARLQDAAPGVQLHIEPVTDASIRRLMNGDVDACYWPYDLSLFGLRAQPPELRVLELRPAPWVCIASSHHHDFSAGFTREAYLKLRHIVPRPSLGADNVEDVWKRLFHVNLDIAASTNSMLALPSIVASTRLAATVPEALLELIPPQLPIQWRPVPLDLPVPQESLLWHRRHDNEPSHGWLRSLFVTARR